MFVVCLRRLRDLTAALNSVESSKLYSAPLKVCDTGRAKSVGNSSTGAAPATCFFQYSSCWSKSSPASQSLCHCAKSAYWTGSSGSDDSSPREKLLYSDAISLMKIPTDQP